MFDSSGGFTGYRSIGKDVTASMLPELQSSQEGRWAQKPCPPYVLN